MLSQILIGQSPSQPLATLGWIVRLAYSQLYLLEGVLVCPCCDLEAMPALHDGLQGTHVSTGKETSSHQAVEKWL